MTAPPAALGELRRVDWRDLSAMLAGRLCPPPGVRPVDCGDLPKRGRPTRVVMQVIENVFYKWKEYDLPVADGRRHVCIEMVRPRRGALSAQDAATLLSASELWRESAPDPEDLVVLDPRDPRLTAPPIESRLSADDIQRLRSANGGAGSLRQPRTPIGPDDRERVTATTGYPWRDICYMDVTLPDGGAGRGSGFLVAPYTVLTAGHVVYSLADEGFMAAIGIAPGQRQDYADGPVYRPHGERSAYLIQTDPAYAEHAADDPLRYEHDYGAAHFRTPFDISSYMPLAFDVDPAQLSTAGYPYEVQGEEESNAMWYSRGDVTETYSRIFFHLADTSSGNSGGAMWGDPSSVEVTAILTGGGETANVATRLVSENMGYVELWMHTFPAGEIDLWEPDDTPDSADPITHDVQQEHSIVPASDEDWLTFTLETRSDVWIWTDGESGDTRLWLYDEQLNELAFDDDSGDGSFSWIDRPCDAQALPPGTYYVKIDSYDHADVIDEYEAWFYINGTCDEACPGDCDGNGQVTINELVLGVTIALDMESADACGSMDWSNDGRVTVDELVAAVSKALGGC